MMVTATFSLEADTRIARLGVRAAAILAPVIGKRLAIRLAESAVRRGVRYRIDGGRWRPMNVPVKITEGCNHRDGYGSTIIMGEVPGAPSVCMLCDRRFPRMTLLTFIWQTSVGVQIVCMPVPMGRRL